MNLFFRIRLSNQGAEAGNKVVEKVLPNEPVGVVCKVDDKYQVVEYSEIGERNAELRTKDNSKVDLIPQFIFANLFIHIIYQIIIFYIISTPFQLLYNAGNICNHFYTTTFLKNVCLQHNQKLPYHVAKKKIPSVGGEKGRYLTELYFHFPYYSCFILEV